jgi:hypothetical protein
MHITSNIDFLFTHADGAENAGIGSDLVTITVPTDTSVLLRIVVLQQQWYNAIVTNILDFFKMNKTAVSGAVIFSVESICQAANHSIDSLFRTSNKLGILCLHVKSINPW